MTQWEALVDTMTRIVNFAYRIYNLIKFRLYGVKFGKGMCVHGNIGLKIKKSGNFVIGDKFYYSSGRHINPLARNIQGNITINEGAEVVVGNNVCMSGTVIRCHKYIEVGNYVHIGAGTVLLDSDGHSLNFEDRRVFERDMSNKKNQPITIEDDVLIGMNCIIMKGVTIGERSVIGAGSVVTKSIPADCIAAGNPCKVIKSLI